MDAEIINVGTELLVGDSLSNTQHVIVAELANIDVNVFCTNTAGFDPDRLRELLSVALTRSDVIIVIGGMGPNREDITKQTVCDALGITLVSHEISRKRIEEYCRNNGIIPDSLIMSMADMPAGSVVFRNDNGMCPGCAIRSRKQCIVMLPSSPVEVTPMVKSYVIQYLKQLTDGAVFSQVINVFYLGITLHDVEERLGLLLNSANPTIKCTEIKGEVRIRVTAKTNTEQSSRELAAPIIKQIIGIFGEDAYGMNTSGIEEIIVRELKERKMTLSTAESCTAGIISKRITDIPGASRVFEMGAATYASSKKTDMLGVSDKILQKYGAVSPEAAAAMAVGARRLAGSSLAVSTTGIAGPGGGTPLKPVGLVYIALADKENVWIRKTLIQKPGMDRDYVREVAASHALNLVRKYINSLPYLMEGGEQLMEGVRESYFEEGTKLTEQLLRDSAASIPVASLGLGTSYLPPELLNARAPGAGMYDGNAVRSQSVPTPYGVEITKPSPASMLKAGAPAYAPLAPVREAAVPYANIPPRESAMAYANPAPQEQARHNMPAQYQNAQMSYAGTGAPRPMQRPMPDRRNAGRAAVSAKRPRKKTSGAQVLQRIIFIIALLTMLGSGGYLFYNLVLAPYLTSQKMDGVADLIIMTPEDNGDEEAEASKYNEDGYLKKYASLVETNEDFIGWISIPNTVINYPVMQTGEGAPEYYIHRDFYGNYDSNGTIFAYYACDLNRETMSKNTIIFGHHMKSGMMFQNLMYYDPYQKSGNGRNGNYPSNLDFYKENAVISFDTKYAEGTWVVFSVMKCNTFDKHGTPFDYIRVDFQNDDDYQNFIDDIRARSIIDTYSCIDVDSSDYLLTMQTCSYEYSEFRTVVVARRLREGEVINTSSATVATNPVMPEVWGS